MNKILCTFLFMLFAFHQASAQNLADLETFESIIKPGAVLTYDVTNGTKKYQLIVTIKKWGDEIAFDWKTTEPDNKSGSVEANGNSVSKADALFIIFAGGASKLDKESALFLSRKIFNEIAETTQAKLKLNGASDTATTMNNAIIEYNFMVDGNFLSVPGLELEGGSEIKFKVGAIESQKFPLIVKIEYGWTMVLAEIKTQ